MRGPYVHRSVRLCLPPTRRLAPIAWQLPYEVDGAADHDRHGPQPEREAEAGLRGRHARVDGPAQEDRLDGQEDPPPSACSTGSAPPGNTTRTCSTAAPGRPSAWP